MRQPAVQSQRDTDVLLGGRFLGRTWVGGTGYFRGTLGGHWLGIPPTGRAITIRWGEFACVQDGKIVETLVLLDLVDVLLQAGYRVLPPSPGDEGRVPGPATGDGVLLTEHDPQTSQLSLRLVEAMIAGLMRYDGVDLVSMDQRRFWDSYAHWYGPCGIGTARSYAAYEQVHQRPFLHAFPDRAGGHHRARPGEGAYVASTDWPSVRATHLGEWLGCAATGKAVGMRVMDFWRRADDRLVENWVLIDIVDMFRQLGVDLWDQRLTSISPKHPLKASP